METEGLHRCMNFLKERKLEVDVLVTDRHKQINKWLQEAYPKIKHYYDIWHVAKGSYIAILMIVHSIMYTGFRKKVDKLGKQKNCEVVGEWQKSIINHLYWCVSSTPADDDELITAKWLSLDNHIHNVHRRHGNKKFPKCAHGRLRRQERNKKWLQRRKH